MSLLDTHTLVWGLTAPEKLPARAHQILLAGAQVDPLDTLAGIHRDPFDRMLVAQALAEGCTLVTADSTLMRYGVPVVWD